MKTKTKIMKAKAKSPLICFLAVLFLVLLPKPAFAEDNTVDIDGKTAREAQMAIQAAINSADEDDVVTVTGTLAIDNGILELNIAEDLAVCWKADISGNSISVIALPGNGTFEVAKGGKITSEGYGYAIHSLGESSKVIVTGGEVSAMRHTIYASGVNNKVTIEAGKLNVTGNGQSAVYTRGDVEVRGGEVSATGLNVETISARGQSNCNVKITGGKVTAPGGGACFAVYIPGENGAVTISGGEVTSEYMAIYTENTNSSIAVSGGTVRSTGNSGSALAAWSDNSAITVTGGTVMATGRGSEAIRAHGASSTVSVSGGLVFSHGSEITGLENVIYLRDNSEGFRAPTSSGMVIAWEEGANNTSYIGGTSLDIHHMPDGASAYWAVEGSEGGIAYRNSNDKGFIPLEVTVTPTVPGIPQDLVSTPGNRQAELSWQEPANNGGSAITKYQVSKDGGAAWQDVTSGTSYTFTDLTNGQSYTLYVRGCNSAGAGQAAETVVVLQANRSSGGSSSGSSSYTVTFEVNGGSSVSGQAVERGQKVTEPNAPLRDGCTFTGWYTDEDCSEKYDFSTPITQNLTLYAGWREDTPEKEEGVQPYIAGYPDGTFKPDGSITRGEVAQILYTLTKDGVITSKALSMSTDGFTDVSANDWCYDAVIYMTGTGVLSGYPDGSFGPKDSITRAEITTIVVRCMGLAADGTPNFPDTPSDNWAAGYIAAAEAAGLVSGYPDGSFGPKENVTRAQAVTIINRMLNRGEDPALFDSLKNPFSDVPSTHWAWADIMAAAVGRSSRTE